MQARKALFHLLSSNFVCPLSAFCCLNNLKVVTNKNHSDYIALDMETYSLYYAAKHAASDSAKKFLSVKAISDMSDTDKKDIYIKSYAYLNHIISYDT